MIITISNGINNKLIKWFLCSAIHTGSYYYL